MRTNQKEKETHNTMAIHGMKKIGKTTINPNNPPCQ